MKKTKKQYVRVTFPLTKSNLDRLFKIEELFAEMGITFDTGGGCGGRDWEWDWSLKGPIKLEIREA
jgi:hypothetical protein